MSIKKTLLLAILLLGCVYYIFKIEMPAREEQAKKGLLFRDLNQSQIKSIDIISENQKLSLINISSDTKASTVKWGIAGIKDAAAEPSLVSALVTSLSELNLDSPLPKEDLDSDMSVYGLSQPQLTVRVKTKTDEKEIKIGKLNQIIDKRYLAVSGEPEVYMTGSALYDAAGKSTADFRDKTPLDFLDRDLESAELNNEFGEIVLKQQGGKDWLLEKPVKANASREAVMELTRNLRNLSAAEFIDDQLKAAECGLEKPAAVIKLNFADQISQELLFSKVKKGDNEKFYFQAKPASVIYELSADPFLFLSKSQDDFRVKEVFNFAVNKLKSAQLSGSQAAALSLVKDGLEWKVNTRTGDKVFIDQWLSDLAEIRAVSFPASPSDTGFENPKIKLTIETEGGQKRSLIIGNEFKDPGHKTGSRLYIAAADDLNNPFTITEESYKKIDVKEEALLPQQNADPVPAAVN